MKRILVTTTSFQDTPGPHLDKLETAGYDVVGHRVPLTEAEMLELAGEFDGFLCGDDAITRAVLEKALPRLRVVSKYGIGVDKIDIRAATELGIPVTFCPGVNHTTVAEHVFCLLLALCRHLFAELETTRSGRWDRLTGNEILGKTIGIIGLGRIGKEVAKRARAFGLNVIGFDIYWSEDFAAEFNIQRAETYDQIFEIADIITLHTNLTEATRNLINADTISRMKEGVIIINCARGEIVDTAAMVAALKNGDVCGYGADVLDAEPPPSDHPLLRAPNCLITPHIGSRTYESVLRQADMAVKNLIAVMEGREPLAQVNDVPATPA